MLLVLLTFALLADQCCAYGASRMFSGGKPRPRTLTEDEKGLLEKLSVNYENCGVSAQFNDDSEQSEQTMQQRLPRVTSESKVHYNDKEPHTVVTNGFDVRPGQIPWQVSLQMKSEGNHFCGGTIISKCHVITAAHCVSKENSFGMKPKEIRVVYGSINNQVGGEDDSVKSADVKRIIKHSAFEKIEYDIAIVQIKGEFAFDEKVQPVCLPLDQAPFTGSATITGFGLTDEDTKQSTHTMKGGIVNIIAKTECQRTLHTSHFDPKSMLCQGASETGGNDEHTLESFRTNCF